jgi:hypothetical protein
LEFCKSDTLQRMLSNALLGHNETPSNCRPGLLPVGRPPRQLPDNTTERKPVPRISRKSHRTFSRASLSRRDAQSRNCIKGSLFRPAPTSRRTGGELENRSGGVKIKRR